MTDYRIRSVTVGGRVGDPQIVVNIKVGKRTTLEAITLSEDAAVGLLAELAAALRSVRR